MCRGSGPNGYKGVLFDIVELARKKGSLYEAFKQDLGRERQIVRDVQENGASFPENGQ